jgi:hypothetical protein
VGSMPSVIRRASQVGAEFMPGVSETTLLMRPFLSCFSLFLSFFSIGSIVSGP